VFVHNSDQPEESRYVAFEANCAITKIESEAVFAAV